MERFAPAFHILDEAVAARSFPGASVAIVSSSAPPAISAMGRFTYEVNSPQVAPDTMFDLASLTKVVATTAMAMILYQRGLLDLDMPVIEAIPGFSRFDSRKKSVTMRMLLAHSSGLPAYQKLYLQAKTRDQLLDAALETGLTSDPGTHAEYSDIGFIVLGLVLEQLADEPIDRFCQREVFGPLGMNRTTFNPQASLHPTIPPTADDQVFRHRIIQGEVNDENASVMGGVAAHAGVFSNAFDLAKFAGAMLQGGSPIVRSDTLSLFTRRQDSPEGTSRALGWDTPSAPSQSGRYFSQASFGHLGYTGTSIWIDPEARLGIVLLTNRTWPDSKNQAIKQVRPRFHDAVVEALKNQPTGKT
jgi:CubicO group peptidase (beta-lactamase class C family)